jgi:S1-C subfamily serine protease
VYFVQSSGPAGAGTGTAWLFDAGGHLVTNQHVIGGGTEVALRVGENELVPVEVVGQDPCLPRGEHVGLTPELAQRLGLTVQSGALVLEVAPGGPAARAGLRGAGSDATAGALVAGGDVITSIDGEGIAGPNDVAQAVGAKQSGDTSNVTYVRVAASARSRSGSARSHARDPRVRAPIGTPRCGRSTSARMITPVSPITAA